MCWFICSINQGCILYPIIDFLPYYNFLLIFSLFFSKLFFFCWIFFPLPGSAKWLEYILYTRAINQKHKQTIKYGLTICIEDETVEVEQGSPSFSLSE